MAHSALILLLLCSITLAQDETLKKPLYLPEDAENIFEDFITTYQKKYSSNEKAMRFKIFKDNLENVNQQNQEQESAVFGITQFSDLTVQEYKELYSGLKIESFDNNEPIVDVNEPKGIELPENFDWRQRNAVSYVKDQGLCGSCWAFSTTGSLEGAHAVKHNRLYSLSEQQLLDCDTSDNGCGGGLMSNALRYVKKAGGIEDDFIYPYTARSHNCKYKPSEAVVHVAEIHNLNLTNEEALRELLYKQGPISIAIDSEDILAYSHGIISKCRGDQLDHGVLLIGYGTENGIPYWTIKNSWGICFGETGFFRIKRGGNLCGLLNNYAVYPTVH